MDIVLINSIDFEFYKKDSCIPQIGQLILKKILQEKHSVEMINFDYLAAVGEFTYYDTISENIESMAIYILKIKPKIVGFYTICNSFAITVRLANRMKELNPNIKIIFGGPHATLTADYCLKAFPFIDVISMGEGELNIIPLVDALTRGLSLESVSNIKYCQDGIIHTNQRCELIIEEDLAKYTVYDYAPFQITPDNHVEIEGGRGCPFGCTFCSTSPFWGRKFRVKSTNVLLNEMDTFHNLYGTTHFSIVHDMFTANQKHLKEFCNELIKRNCPYEWSCSSRIDVLDEEMIDLMAKSRCVTIFLGIETGSSRMQKLLNKKLNLELAYKRISYLQNSGITPTISFIYGFPDEELGDLKDTLDMIDKLILIGISSIQLHRFMPLPQTVETDKLQGLLYFNKNDIDISIFRQKLYDPETMKLILKHPTAFVQFYTFDSEIRQVFLHLDFLLLLFTAASDITTSLKHIVNYFIRQYGTELIYLQNKDIISSIYTEYQEDTIENYFKHSSISKYVIILLDNLVSKYIQNTLEESIYLYGKMILEYILSDDKEPMIRCFPVDIKSAFKGIEHKQTTYVKLYYDNVKKKYKTSTISPLKALSLIAQKKPNESALLSSIDH